MARVAIIDLLSEHVRCEDCSALMLGAALRLNGTPLDVFGIIAPRWHTDHAAQLDSVDLDDPALRCSCGSRNLTLIQRERAHV